MLFDWFAGWMLTGRDSPPLSKPLHHIAPTRRLAARVDHDPKPAAHDASHPRALALPHSARHPPLAPQSDERPPPAAPVLREPGRRVGEDGTEPGPPLRSPPSRLL